MKVQVSFDLSPDERIAIGVVESGEFKPATREEARAYLAREANAQLAVLTARVKAARRQITEEVHANLKEVPSDE